MGKVAFANLIYILTQRGLLSDIVHSRVEGRVDMFLHTLAYDMQNRTMKFYFRRAGETTSRHFHQVLKALELALHTDNFTRSMMCFICNDAGLSKAVNEEHARDLQLMNIKEDIKSIGVLDLGSPVYQEALFNLANWFKTLQKNCQQLFEEEEERELLPYMEAADLGKVQR